MKNICVFCGSRLGSDPAFALAAKTMGTALVRAGTSLIYGGGNVGLMGLLADSVLAAGGYVTGVIPKQLQDLEVGHTGIQELIVVESMHERKAIMAERCDAFIALPGGFGTFEEFCEIITWAQLGLHAKPIGLLNVNAYYTPLLQMFDQGVKHEFIRPQHRNLILQATSSEELLQMLQKSHAETKAPAGII